MERNKISPRHFLPNIKCPRPGTNQAATQAPAKADRHFLMWKVTSPTNTVYLFGSIHVGDSNLYPLPKAVESAFHSLLLGTGHLLNKRSDHRAREACANMLQDFIYTYYPEHPDLRVEMARRVAELGGSNLQADGPPRFKQLQKLTGWKLARRIQQLAYRTGYKPTPARRANV